ncbi:uncharacterized protein LOC144180227 [Haemaphysalis longicornis]
MRPRPVASSSASPGYAAPNRLPKSGVHGRGRCDFIVTVLAERPARASLLEFLASSYGYCAAMPVLLLAGVGVALVALAFVMYKWPNSVPLVTGRLIPKMLDRKEPETLRPTSLVQHCKDYAHEIHPSVPIILSAAVIVVTVCIWYRRTLQGYFFGKCNGSSPPSPCDAGKARTTAPTLQDISESTHRSESTNGASRAASTSGSEDARTAQEAETLSGEEPFQKVQAAVGASRSLTHSKKEQTTSAPSKPRSTSLELLRASSGSRMGVLFRSPHSTSAVEESMLGGLLNACNQREPSTFADIFKAMDADKFTMMSESRHAEVYRVHSYKGDSVLKLVKLDLALKLWNRLISEVLITKKLCELRKSSEFFTTGFIDVRSVTCVLDDYPDELQMLKKIAATDTENVKRAYLAWHMTNAGVPLDKFKFTDVLQLWSILQQIALTLAVAEEALQFEHRDLRLDRVLVGATREKTAKFIIRGRNLVVKTRGVEARITGFASSRLNDGDTPIFTELDDLFERPTNHEVQFVYKHMTSIIR